MRYLADLPCIKNKKACFNRINKYETVLKLNLMFNNIDKL